jgi:outer membrane cobalamin receptor
VPSLLAAGLLLGSALLAQATPVEIEGQVVSRRGAPVAEAQIVLLRAQLGQADVVVESTDTDRAGRFRVPPIPPGAYLLDVRADGFQTLRYAFDLATPIENLILRLDSTDDPGHTTFVYGPTALPGADGTSTSTISAKEIRALPGGTTRPLDDVIATQPGITRDNYGAIHVRGNFAGLQLRVDDIPLPPSVQDRLQQLLDSQIVDRADVIVGGLPAEYGESVAGVVDIRTRRPGPNSDGELQLTYGSYNTVQGQASGAGRFGPLSVLAAGSLATTQRGLDPPAATPVLHDRLRDGRAFLSADDRLSAADHLRVLAAYGESHYQTPIDPTLLPLSAAPPGGMRGEDQYGNDPPNFVPYDANPTEDERDLFGALSWFHDFAPRATLQVAPFVRYEHSQLSCDPAGALGPTADPGQTCSDVSHRVVQGGAVVNQTVGVGRHDIKAGLLFDDQHSTVGYAEYFRDDASATGGPDPAQTVAGQDQVNVVLGAAYVQDRITIGKWTLFPGVRLDLERASFGGTHTSLVGPSVRLGGSYAFSPHLLGHAFIGNLWQPPTYDAPTAARVLGVVPSGAPVPVDLVAEQDLYAEVGLVAQPVPQLRLAATPWVRLSRHTIDDNEVGDTALTADYNYDQGRAAGFELGAVWALWQRLHGFANVTFMLSEGSGIASARYLFTPEQLAFSGYQSTDNAQKVSTNAGLDLADQGGRTHLSGLVTFGSGLRTGPTNNATLPASTVVDVTLRHRFDIPLRPEVAIDVRNLFDVVYAYRIATGSLAGTAYGSLREVFVRVIIPWGGT